MQRAIRAGVVAAAALLVSTAIVARADEVVFKNGDKLTGKIVSADGGKLVVDTAVAGKVTVDMANVKTFSTDAPVDLRLKDGSTVKDSLAPGAEEGQVATKGSGDIAAQPMPIANIAKINPQEKWTGSIVAGALITRGNSETDNVNISIDAMRRREDDRITASAGYLYGKQEDPDTGDDQTTVDNWFLLGKYDYFLSEKLYLYALGRIERDRIADLDLRVAPSVGVGYQWVERPDFNFSTEAGIGWMYEDFETGDSEDHFAARFAYHVDKQLNDKVSVFHNLEYLPSVEDIDDFNLNADVGIKANMTERMFTQFKIEWKYDAEPAPDAEKNDVRYILGVGWSF
jgi:putative salt-induced outer membrane protein YdiY